jgi:hypothetical protein
MGYYKLRYNTFVAIACGVVIVGAVGGAETLKALL